jgi:FkbM family methyltransferase
MYAQSGEDDVLRRIFPGDVGFYVDVGASDPTYLSNTKLFYDLGWSGINVEPSPGDFGKLAAARPRDLNLNIALSDAEEELPFYLAQHTVVSSFNKADVERSGSYQTIRLRTSTLRAVLEEHAKKPIDFMCVDVEGFERRVLGGNDWARFRPRALLIEYDVTGRNTTHEWEGIVLDAGYRFEQAVGCNRLYLL